LASLALRDAIADEEIRVPVSSGSYAGSWLRRDITKVRSAGATAVAGAAAPNAKRTNTL
jgi:hypothetical protein